MAVAGGWAQDSTGGAVGSADGAEGEWESPFVGMHGAEKLNQFGLGCLVPLLATCTAGAGGHRAGEGCARPGERVCQGGGRRLIPGLDAGAVGVDVAVGAVRAARAGGLAWASGVASGVQEG
jgi:hypothetical protein